MEMYRRILRGVCALLVLCVGVDAVTKNVLIIVGDGAGLEAGAYNNTGISTPNLDALAKNSVLFEYAFTSDPSSSSSRSTVLTGLPGHQNGMYGSSDNVSHFSSFSTTPSLSLILAQRNITTGIIGTKGVKPDSVFKFDFEATEERYDVNNVGRNITLIKLLARTFLNNTDSSFFLYVGLHDPQRCPDDKHYGHFCEKFGNGEKGMGVIPDWKPVSYTSVNVTLPYFLPDNLVTRQDLADMYTAYSRLDQGVGLLIHELDTAGVLNDTLVIYTSDSSIPFPSGKDNLYESGMRVPLLLSSPLHKHQWGQTEALVSSVDLLTTILAWYGLPYPDPSANLTGKSLLPLLDNPTNITNYDIVFSSHNLAEVDAYYPMRAIRTPRYRLIHNLNHRAPFPLSSDIATSPTFKDIVNNTVNDEPTMWIKSLKEYFYRPQWELYDLNVDFMEVDNLAEDPGHASLFEALRTKLSDWQTLTKDPLRCLPAGVLLPDGTCLDSYNDDV